MTTDQARAAGVKPARPGDDGDPAPTGLEVAVVDLVILAAPGAGHGTLVAAGDEVPAHLADLPRVARDTFKPLKK